MHMAVEAQRKSSTEALNALLPATLTRAFEGNL
jgi:hypothetical protein